MGNGLTQQFLESIGGHAAPVIQIIRRAGLDLLGCGQGRRGGFSITLDGLILRSRLDAAVYADLGKLHAIRLKQRLLWAGRFCWAGNLGLFSFWLEGRRLWVNVWMNIHG